MAKKNRQATAQRVQVHLPENKQFESGAVRGKEEFIRFIGRFDLISHVGERRLAETYGEGAAKYGDYNWLKGIPFSNLMMHVMDHINMYRAGDNTEDHLAHAAWGLFAMMHFEVTNPELNDLFYHFTKEENELKRTLLNKK